MVSSKNNLLENHCLNFFSDLPYRKLILAYSGGIDSSVLLECILNIKDKLGISLRTIHINHNLNNFSNQYQNHCETIARQKNIRHNNFNVFLDNTSNLEEKCRELRYNELSKNCRKDEVIILAHHLDDQIETFLIRMFRGSSIKGMSAMSNITVINNVILLRPLLNIKKEDIITYSKKNSISYIEDITNVDETHDRNFIRKNLLPLIKKRWTSIEKSIHNNTSIFSIQNQFLNDQACMLLESCSENNFESLCISKIKKLSYSAQVIIIHHWVFQLNQTILNLRQIHEIIKFFDATNDKNPLFEFNNVRIIKNRDRLLIKLQK